MTGIDLFAVQPHMTLDDYRDADAFSTHMLRLVDGIANRLHEHALVVFPEDLATFLALGAAPAGLDGVATLDEAFAQLGRKLAARLLWSRARYRTGSLEAAFLLTAAPRVYRAWYTTFSAVARATGATVVAGSALIPENRLGYGSAEYAPQDGRVYNLSLAFGPDGRVVDHTAKVNLVPTQEDVLHLTPSTAPRTVYRAGPATVGTAICYDAFLVPHSNREPGFRSQVTPLADLGATIIAQPSANPWRWEEPWSRSGLPGRADGRLRREQWREEGLAAAMRADPRIVAGVNPQLLTSLWDVHFDGRSAILVRQGDRVDTVAQAPRADCHPDSEAVIHWSLTL